MLPLIGVSLNKKKNLVQKKFILLAYWDLATWFASSHKKKALIQKKLSHNCMY